MLRTARASSTNKPRLNLAIIRSKSGLSLRQIADTTKISLRFLQAIEEEEFEKLPGGIFARSYIQQYAGAIGINPEEVLEAYRRATSPDSPTMPTRPETPARPVRLLGFLHLS